MVTLLVWRRRRARAPGPGARRVLHIIVQTLKIVTIAAMALLVVAGGARFFFYAVERTTPDDAGKTFRVRITEDDTPDKIADELVRAGLIRSKLLFTTQLRASAIVSGRALELKPGEHIIRKGMSVDQIIARVTGTVVETEAEVAEADASSGETFQITIPEGWRIEQIADEYEALGGEGGARAFLKAVNEVDRSRYDFLVDVPPNASLEGFLFPDTYTFYRDDPAYDVDLMLLNFSRKVTPEDRKRAEEMQLGLRNVLTLASLVEREAQVDAERSIRCLPQPAGAGVEPRSRSDDAVRPRPARRRVVVPGHPRRSRNPGPLQHLQERRPAAWANLQSGTGLDQGRLGARGDQLHVLCGPWRRIRRTRLRRNR
jgi:cell division protein YceG involved in septum cleavage